MLVKKINPEWFPSENPSLEVGQYVEINDPRDLILSGQVVGIVDGLEVSPYELYGVMTDSELADFKEYLQFKKIKQLKERQEQLQVEAEKLKEELVDSEMTPEEKRLKNLAKAREARLNKKSE